MDMFTYRTTITANNGKNSDDGLNICMKDMFWKDDKSCFLNSWLKIDEFILYFIYRAENKSKYFFCNDLSKMKTLF